MEDRYLFRAKRLDNNEWVIGYIIQRGSNYYIVDISKLEIDTLSFDTGLTVSYEHHINKKSTIRVDKETVGQCTGIKDINGELLFEGDIINLDSKVRRVVIFDDGGFKLRAIIGNFADVYCDLYVVETYRCMRIGDIYNNPELLEDKGTIEIKLSFYAQRDEAHEIATCSDDLRDDEMQKLVEQWYHNKVYASYGWGLATEQDKEQYDHIGEI